LDSSAAESGTVANAVHAYIFTAIKAFIDSKFKDKMPLLFYKSED